MDEFEYRTIVYDTKGFFGGKVDNGLEEQLNFLGSRGWELVSSVSTNANGGKTMSIIAILKRKISG